MGGAVAVWSFELKLDLFTFSDFEPFIGQRTSRNIFDKFRQAVSRECVDRRIGVEREAIDATMKRLHTFDKAIAGQNYNSLNSSYYTWSHFLRLSPFFNITILP